MYVVLSIVGVILLYSIITANKLLKNKNKTSEAFSIMDVYLKKRWDLLPNLLETVKGYNEHEIKTLEKIIEERNTSYANLKDNEKIKTNEQINENLPKIMFLKEAYPNLKANENFLELQKQLVKIEDEIANARKYYNGTVRDYNNLVEMIPSNLIAKLMNLKPKEMFQIEKSERNNIEVSK